MHQNITYVWEGHQRLEEATFTVLQKEWKKKRKKAKQIVSKLDKLPEGEDGI